MKYPSVFFAVLFAWVAIISIALYLNKSQLSYQLYLSGIVFSIAMFVVGFWRNK